ncbi:hypothetical protein P8882_01680 [Bacillus haynesii]|nr:hypothetical protein [Bacillus haynesii]
MAKTKRYVRILKAGNPRYWYVNKIGRMFEFEREGNFTYKIREEDGHLAAIRKSDAELIVTEKRPAKVGEKVLIIDDLNEPKYMLHDVVPVIGYVYKHGVGVKKIDVPPLFLTHEHYEVIVNNEVKNEEADEMENKLLIENAKTVFEKKGDKYFGYKSRLGDIVIGGNYSYAFVVHYAKTNEDVVIIPGDVNAVTTPVCTTEEERLWKPENSAQERRDEIVEQAKADVERLTARGLDGSQAGGFRGSYTYRSTYYVVKFNVNRNKRAVTAIVRASDYTGKNLSDAEIGIAKATPDDCFNEHIGKAIALHRALGLEVPDEYLNAPQPTEVRVGDVVRSTVDKSNEYVIAKGEKAWHEGMAGLSSMVAKYGRIIDDSRTEVGE